MEQIRIDIVPKGIMPVCHASQYDKGRVIRCNLMDGLQGYVLTTETIVLNVRKPDDNIVTAAVEVIAGKTYVDIVTTEQMTACEGNNICELTMSKNDVVISTMNFKMQVEVDPLKDGIESETEIHNLTTQIHDINTEMVPQMVADEVASQYDSANVIFDDHPTAGHGTGYVVKSENVPDELNDLDDVSIDTPASNQALVWDADNNKWTNGEVSTVGSIDDLNDVDTSGKASGDSLRYDGNEWVAKPTTIEMTQAEYNTISDFTPYANTHIVITDAANLNPTADDIEYSSGVTVKQAIDGKADISTPTQNLSCPRCPISSFDSYKIQRIGNIIFFSVQLSFGNTSESGYAYFTSALVDNADFVQGSFFDDIGDTGYQIYKGLGPSIWIRNGNVGIAGADLKNKTRMFLNLIIVKAT